MKTEHTMTSSLWAASGPASRNEKHTQGPWTLCGLSNEDEQPDIVGADETYIGSVGSNLADARLIAACPDLLEAAQITIDTMQWAIKTGNTKMACEQMTDGFGKLQAAISKATGAA